MRIKVQVYSESQNRIDGHEPLDEQIVTNPLELLDALRTLHWKGGFYYRYSHPDSGEVIRSLEDAIKLLPDSQDDISGEFYSFLALENALDYRHKDN